MRGTKRKGFFAKKVEKKRRPEVDGTAARRRLSHLYWITTRDPLFLDEAAQTLRTIEKFRVPSFILRAETQICQNPPMNCYSAIGWSNDGNKPEDFQMNEEV